MLVSILYTPAVSVRYNKAHKTNGQTLFVTLKESHVPSQLTGCKHTHSYVQAYVCTYVHVCIPKLSSVLRTYTLTHTHSAPLYSLYTQVLDAGVGFKITEHSPHTPYLQCSHVRKQMCRCADTQRSPHTGDL